VSADLDGSVCESEAARLLPWLVTGRLAAADSERVSRHLEHCAICQADLKHEQSLRAMLKDDGPVELAPQAGLARTMARIDELTREVPARGATLASLDDQSPAIRRAPAFRWLAAAVVVQAIGLGVLGAAYVRHTSAPSSSAAYETLTVTAAATTGPRIRTVFATAMTVGDLRELLLRHRLAVVAGPSEAVVFTLTGTAPGFDRGDADALLTELRNDPRILFAEPAAGERASPK
jgi:hypothetical protein